MIRRLCYAGALMLLLAGFCLYPLFSVRAHCGAIDQSLEQAAQSALDGDLGAATAPAKRAAELFDDWQQNANMYLRHAELDPVKEAMGELLARLETDDADEFYAVCRRVQRLVDHLTESELPTLGNLL